MHKHLTYEEVKKQYAALKQTYEYMLSMRTPILSLYQKEKPASITFAGCGSSYCLSQSAAFSVMRRAGIPSWAVAGGDLMLNHQRYTRMIEGTLLVAPSRSGSTTEVVEAVRRIRSERRVPLLAISCVADSELSQQADLALELPWAFDHSVCQTRTVINLYTANLMIAAFLGSDESLLADIESAISQGEAYMNRVENGIREVCGDFEWTQAVVLADGELHGLASEGAIALIEIAKANAQARHLLDVRHGPMVTIGADTLVIAALTEGGQEHQRKLMQEIKGRGARIIAFGDETAGIPADEVDLAIEVQGKLDIAAQGIPFIFIPQIAALSHAERQGINPDQPDGLTAWVKL